MKEKRKKLGKGKVVGRMLSNMVSEVEEEYEDDYANDKNLHRLKKSGKRFHRKGRPEEELWQ